MRLTPTLHTLFSAFLVLAAALSAGPASAAGTQLRLAVVELRNEAELKPSEVAYLTDQVRSQASLALSRERFLMMTRESIVALLPPGKTLADCQKTQCEVEVGRTIGADYIVTGEVLRFGESLRLSLKVHHCVSGAFLGSQTARGPRVDDLESGIVTASGALFAEVRTHAGVSAPSGQSSGGVPSEGSLGVAPPVWNPTAKKKRVVRITSDPSGAVVLMDGQLLCPSTPCSREVAPGVVQLQMQKERYALRTEPVTIPAEGAVPAVEWKLAPTFGWLTVRTSPESLAVTVDGEPAGNSPVVRRETDPGSHEVRVADARYYDTGQRVTVVMGAEREVALAATPREGAVEVSAVDAQGNAVTGTVSADGRKLGEVPGTYRLMVGTHKLEVQSEAGVWAGSVEVKERQETVVRAEVKQAVRHVANGTSGETVVRGDLMWTVRDNGRDVKWNEAKAYCEACRVGGYTDWRMPTIEELQGLYVAGNSHATSGKWSDGSAWTLDVHIAKPFLLTTPFMWSSTRDGSSSAFFFDFLSGGRSSLGLAYRYLARVLCVRRSGE